MISIDFFNRIEQVATFTSVNLKFLKRYGDRSDGISSTSVTVTIQERAKSKLVNHNKYENGHGTSLDGHGDGRQETVKVA